jgi:hypothetical protein
MSGKERLAWAVLAFVFALTGSVAGRLENWYVCFPMMAVAVLCVILSQRGLGKRG